MRIKEGWVSLLHIVTQAEGNSALVHMQFLSSGHWYAANKGQECEAVRVGPTSLLLRSHWLELSHMVTSLSLKAGECLTPCPGLSDSCHSPQMAQFIGEETELLRNE